MLNAARLKQLISLSQARGAAVFAVEGSRFELVMSESLSAEVLGRLFEHLSGEAKYDGGTWVHRNRGPTALHLFLATESCPLYVIREAEKYLTLWLCLLRTHSGIPATNEEEQES